MAERHDHDDEVAERLVDSARQLLLDGGLEAVTVRSVAGGAGMSTMNVYSRFGGKDGILDVLHREGFELLKTYLDEVDQPDLAAYLRAAAGAYRRFALAEPARYELMFGGEGRGFRPSSESAELARAMLAGVVERVEEAVQRGEIEPPSGVDGVLVASTLWAMCHGALAFERDSVAASVLEWSAVHDTGVAALIDQLCGRIEAIG